MHLKNHGYFDHRKKKLKELQLEPHAEIKLAQVLWYPVYICGGVWIWFWYQIKVESVLLTMIPKTQFTQNVTCSLFCGSASQTYLTSSKPLSPLFFPCATILFRISSFTSWNVHKIKRKWLLSIHTLCTPHACSSQSELMILKLCESSSHALFLYNCTLRNSE